MHERGRNGKTLRGTVIKNDRTLCDIDLMDLHQAVTLKGLGSDPSLGRSLVGWAEDVAEVFDHFGIDEFRATRVTGDGPYVLAAA